MLGYPTEAKKDAGWMQYSLVCMSILESCKPLIASEDDFQGTTLADWGGWCGRPRAGAVCRHPSSTPFFPVRSKILCDVTDQKSRTPNTSPSLPRGCGSPPLPSSHPFPSLLTLRLPSTDGSLTCKGGRVHNISTCSRGNLGQTLGNPERCMNAL